MNCRLRLSAHICRVVCLSVCPLSAIYDSVSPQACHCTQRSSVISSWSTRAKHLLMHGCGVNVYLFVLAMYSKYTFTSKSKYAEGQVHLHSRFHVYLWKPEATFDELFFLLSLHDHFTVHTVCWTAFSVKYDPVLDFLQSMCSALFYASGSFIKIMSLSRYWNIALWRILFSLAFCWRGIWHSSWINHLFSLESMQTSRCSSVHLSVRWRQIHIQEAGSCFSSCEWHNWACMVGCFSTYKHSHE